MGYQQIILGVLLTVVVVAAALVVSLNVVGDRSASSNLDAITADLVALAAKAQEFYRRPETLGGGGYSFAKLGKDNGMAYLTNQASGGGASMINENGSYQIKTNGTLNNVVIMGLGKDDGDGDGINCSAEVDVYPDSITFTINSR